MNTLRNIIAVHGRIVDAIRTASDEHYHGAFVFDADGNVERAVTNLGWLLRHRGEILHPMVGCAFTVRTWRYHGGTAAGGYARQDRFPSEPILIAALDDGRFYATQWADPSILHDWLDRPSFRGYLCDWQSPIMEGIPTCAIGGRDWGTIPDTIAEHRARVKRERDNGNPAFATAA